MMTHTGFDSLFCISSNTNPDWGHLEKKYMISIPNTYKQLVNTYSLGRGSLRKENLLISKENIQIPLLCYYYGEGDTFLTIEDFFDIEESIAMRKSDVDIVQDENWNLMRIAFTNDAGGGGVYIGLKESNFGKIYKFSWLGGSAPLLLSEDIFDFIKGIKSVFNLPTIINSSSIYKNWGEDFWRIREEGNTP